MTESRIIKRKEPISEKNMAFINWLRKHEASKMTYSFDVYAEVYHFQPNVYSIMEETADGTLNPWMHLICGEERALLVDTGFGIGNLKEIIDYLVADKPVIVFNTHHHIDHISGNYAFDVVHTHKYSVPYLENEMRPEHWDGLFDEKGKGIWLDVRRDDVIAYKPYKIFPCDNHHKFVLGPEHVVEVIHIPGHAPGNCVLLDRKNKALFSGDTIMTGRISIPGVRENQPFGEYMRLSEMIEGLNEVLKETGAFEKIYPGHNMLPLPAGTVADLYESCREVVENPEDYDYMGLNYMGKEVLLKNVKGLGVLEYKLTSI